MMIRNDDVEGGAATVRTGYALLRLKASGRSFVRLIDVDGSVVGSFGHEDTVRWFANGHLPG